VSQTYHNMLMHVIFSTKERAMSIPPDVRPRLYKYIGKIIQNNFGYLIRIGGTEDHIHILFNMKPSVCASNVLRDIKAYSSGWIHKTFRNMSGFAWQAGYGIFSVSQSRKQEVIDYINNQEAHHRKMGLREEIILLLRKNGIEYDEKHLWR